MFTIPLGGHPGNYHLGLLTNHPHCSFEEAVQYIASVEINKIFPPAVDATIHHNASVVARIRLPLFDLATYIGLNLPMESFNIFRIFGPQEAEFKSVLDCRDANKGLTVKNVVQESRIKLTSDLFAARVHEQVDDGGSGFLVPEDKNSTEDDAGLKIDLCRRHFLFFVRNMDSGELVLFGRRDNSHNNCG